MSKVEDAIDCYQRAANLFKMAKKWSQAGRAFILAADLNSKSGRKHDAATNYVDSANCFKKTDPNGMIVYSIFSILFLKYSEFTCVTSEQKLNVIIMYFLFFACI